PDLELGQVHLVAEQPLSVVAEPRDQVADRRVGFDVYVALCHGPLQRLRYQTSPRGKRRSVTASACRLDPDDGGEAAPNLPDRAAHAHGDRPIERRAFDDFHILTGRQAELAEIPEARAVPVAHAGHTTTLPGRQL